jgi:hypothetical protein
VEPFDGGFRITSRYRCIGGKLKHTINKTMMRIDLPKPLAPGAVYSFKIGWWFPINDRMKVGGRSGYEYFEEEDNYLYTIAQFYPRMCAYMDYSGWMHKQFLGSGEFTLDFGDYDLSITVPSDHIVGATGVLQNESAVLTAEQRSRLAKARTCRQAGDDRDPRGSAEQRGKDQGWWQKDLDLQGAERTRCRLRQQS